jgi:hypothetical protein
LRAFAVVLACAIVVACSGNGTSLNSPHGQASATPNGQGAQPPLNATIDFSIVVPPAPPASTSSHARRLKPLSTVYISPNTGSVALRVVAVNGVSLAAPPAAQGVDIPASCQGSTGCTVALDSVAAAAGADQFAVTTFTGAGESGTVISSGLIVVNVSAGRTAEGTIGGATQLALGGYVAAIVLSAAPSYLPSGAGTNSIVVMAKDAAGATIVGNAVFAYPIVLSVAGTGLSLSGAGLQPNGTVQLTQPQSSGITLTDNGTATSGTLTATSINSGGATVTGSLTLLPYGVSPPPPSPTPTPVGQTPAPPPTLPPPTPTPKPTPTASGAPPSPTPSPLPSNSVYVLNATTNTIAEFSEPSIGSGTQLITTPVRVFGGTTVGCPPSLEGFPGLQGIASDPLTSDLWVATDGQECSPTIPQSMYAFGPSATGSEAPSITIKAPAAGGSNSELSMIAFQPSSSTMDAVDLGYPYDIVSVYALSGGHAIADLGQNGCVISPGLPNGATSGNPCNDSVDYGFFSPQSESDGSTPMAIGPDGTIYLAVYDNENTANAVVAVSPANQVTGTALEANATWLEGSSTGLVFPQAMSVDGSTSMLWVLDNLGDGTNMYLLGYNLSTAFAASCSGPCNVTPTTLIGGGSVGRLPPSGISFPYQNGIDAANGRVYVASTYGPTCGPSYCENGSFAAGPYGEVDAYNGTLTGTHDNDPASAPIAIFYGTDVLSPLGVGYGPHGTPSGSASVRIASARPMRPTRYVNPVLLQFRRRALALRAQRLARLHLRPPAAPAP